VEALCDGCGRCCLVKIEDEEAGTLEHTDLCCDHLDVATCRCTRYSDRFELGTDCIRLTPKNVAESPPWLPGTCAYRLVAEGHDLPPWHPLVSGDASSVHDAGASVANRVVPEGQVDDDDLEDHIVDLTW
jgi:uncharacterized cysteine cluster protein YcgN (CxxCxxCC family)